jgi:hypothetical protein
MTEEIRAIGTFAGNNKFGLKTCPLCGEKGSERPHLKNNFMFRDALSLAEYRISALCQDCQDDMLCEFLEEENE